MPNKSNNTFEPVLQETKVDLHLLASLLKIVNEQREELEWVLQKQSQLRIEYVTFFKKDLGEIIATLADHKTPDSGLTDLITNVSETFRTDIEKSLSIVDARYQETIQKQIIDRATEELKAATMEHFSKIDELPLPLLFWILEPV